MKFVKPYVLECLPDKLPDIAFHCGGKLFTTNRVVQEDSSTCLLSPACAFLCQSGLGIFSKDANLIGITIGNFMAALESDIYLEQGDYSAEYLQQLITNSRYESVCTVIIKVS